MNEYRKKLLALSSIFIGALVFASGVLINISERNTIGFTLTESDQIIITEPDIQDNWGVIIDESYLTFTTETPTSSETPTTPPESSTTEEPLPIFDPIIFDVLVFTKIDEFTIECRFGFLPTEHDIKEATISFSKNGHQIVDENGSAVFLECDKIGVRGFKTEFDWWSFPEGTLDVDITIKFDVYIYGVKIPELENTIGFYDDKGQVIIPEHSGEKPSNIPEYHIKQGIGKILMYAGIGIFLFGVVIRIKKVKHKTRKR